MRAQFVRVADLAARWRTELLELFFPLRCIGCRRPGPALCPECLARIHLLQEPRCPCCGRLLPHAGMACDCRGYPQHLDGIQAATLHQGVARAAIHGLKYDHRTELAVPLGSLLQRYLEHYPLDFDRITAVPLHPARERERGYNQAELVAVALAARIGSPYVKGLERIRETADQVGLKVAERHANVRDAFRANALAFRGGHILLIDDVCTTGATLDACAAALRTEGARTVYGLTITRPQGTRPVPSEQEGSYHR
ncbi:MAG: ComF family protein [Anaerolineae bacterium]